MADIPLLWRAYAAYQSNLNGRASVDATSHGIEEGLNYLLESDNPVANPTDVDRIVTNAARRARYARSLLAKHISIRSEVHDGTGHIEARSSLALLQRRMPSAKLALLVELSKGAAPAELAASHRIDVGCVRTRIARARQIARTLAA